MSDTPVYDSLVGLLHDCQRDKMRPIVIVLAPTVLYDLQMEIRGEPPLKPGPMFHEVNGGAKYGFMGVPLMMNGGGESGIYHSEYPGAWLPLHREG